jgi:two-component system response regulator GlrR
LLVDDDPALPGELSALLRDLGHDLQAETSVAGALRAITALRPDLVITDPCMRDANGVRLLEELDCLRPGLPVLILTASGTIRDAVAAIRSGAFGFLTKPPNTTEFVEHVNKALSLCAPAGITSGWRAGIITRSPLMEDLLLQASMVARSDASVLITGLSGVGKELLARAIHLASPRRGQSLVALNSGAIPEHLLESELFGHEQGAFTGATRSHMGLFRAADSGTLFLDEIGDMPLALQTKLLRVLQEGLVRPVGRTQASRVDVRVISATHRDLEQAIVDGTFREDLFYRLNVVELAIPSLNQRCEDIPLLVAHFLKQLAGQDGEQPKTYAPAAIERLVAADWPGNVRQLYNVVRRTVALSPTPVISARLVEDALSSDPRKVRPYAQARADFTHSYLTQLLHVTRGNVSQAARIASHSRTDLYKLLARHHIDPTLFKDA